ncbi:MAG: hypothetical protein L0Y72_24115 [Gemmataceae bacterium]|nr:hypothetical protein [Gemmataceae bacterium]MCI0742132.1 hypothetical protein [Gemmataceae bacterium]
MLQLRRLGLATLALAVMAAGSAQALDPKLLPADTELVFTVNVKQIMDSELVRAQKEAIDQAKAILENLGGANPVQKYLQDAGFDFFTDLYSLTVATAGSKDADKAFIAVEGKFNVPKFNGAAEAAAKDNPDGLRITKQGDATVYEITPPGEKRIYASLVNSKLLIAAPTKESLNDALGRISNNRQANLKKEVRTLLETVNKKQSVSFVATGSALAKMMEGAPIPNAEIAGQALQSIDGLSGAITITREIQFQLGVNAKDEDTAKKMSAGGNVALLTVRALVEQRAKEDQKLAPVVDIVKTLRISSQGSNILLRGEVSLDVIEKLMKNLPGGQ